MAGRAGLDSVLQKCCGKLRRGEDIREASKGADMPMIVLGVIIGLAQDRL
jgi:hypothetical protein